MSVGVESGGGGCAPGSAPVGSSELADSSSPKDLAVVLMMLFSIAVLALVLCCTAIPRSAGGCSGKLMDLLVISSINECAR